VANEMAYIANKGWFIIPHIVDSIEGGDKFNLLSAYREKHVPLEIPDSIFDAVQDGMQGVIDHGTGMGARIPGIVMCGKTGTVENYYRGVKQKNHSFFTAFAPRDNPRIAIMCVVENSGRFGGTYAAPIVSLMIEKYLNDTIAASRLAMEENMVKTNLIPPMMLDKMRIRDSLQQVREAEKALKNELKNISDTLQSEENITVAEMNNDKRKNLPAKDTQRKRVINPDMLLPDKKDRTQQKKDSLRR
jgi:penicillin-binding protein 2